MSHPIFSQIVICPIRFSIVAILASLLATFNPIAPDASLQANETFSGMYFVQELAGDAAAVAGMRDLAP